MPVCAFGMAGKVGETVRKYTLADRASARPASGWFVRGGPGIRIGIRPGAGRWSPGQNRSGVFLRLVTRVWA